MTFISLKWCLEQVEVLVIPDSALHSSEYVFEDVQQPELLAHVPMRDENVQYFAVARFLLCISITLSTWGRTTYGLQQQAAHMLTSVLSFQSSFYQKSNQAIFNMQTLSSTQCNLSLSTQNSIPKSSKPERHPELCIDSPMYWQSEGSCLFSMKMKRKWSVELYYSGLYFIK